MKIRDGVRYYGVWAGNPMGIRENTTHCIKEVWPNDRGSTGRQCGRKRGHGRDRLYCAQHNPAHVEAREQASINRRKQEEAKEQATLAEANDLIRRLGCGTPGFIIDIGYGEEGVRYRRILTITFEEAARLIERLTKKGAKDV